MVGCKEIGRWRWSDVRVRFTRSTLQPISATRDSQKRYDCLASNLLFFPTVPTHLCVCVCVCVGLRPLGCDNVGQEHGD